MGCWGRGWGGNTTSCPKIEFRLLSCCSNVHSHNQHLNYRATFYALSVRFQNQVEFRLLSCCSNVDIVTVSTRSTFYALIST